MDPKLRSKLIEHNDAGVEFCVIGDLFQRYQLEDVKRPLWRRLWNAVRYNPIQSWWANRQHDRYCCRDFHL